MKLISGYLSGLAVASCFAGAGDTAYFLIGGIAGALPHVIDRMVLRHTDRADIDIITDPLRPDAKMIADSIADAVDSSFNSNTKVLIRLRTSRCKDGLWMDYSVSFDVAHREVNVSFAGAESDLCTGSACFLYNIRLDELVRIEVSGGDCVMLAFERCSGMVRISRDPSRGTWSHSLITGFLLALAVVALFDNTAGVVVFLAWCLHVFADRIGYACSAIWFPFHRERVLGIRKIDTEGDMCNFAISVMAIMVIWVVIG